MIQNFRSSLQYRDLQEPHIKKTVYISNLRKLILLSIFLDFYEPLQMIVCTSFKVDALSIRFELVLIGKFIQREMRRETRFSPNITGRFLRTVPIGPDQS